jgi:hypothetical protein
MKFQRTIAAAFGGFPVLGGAPPRLVAACHLEEFSPRTGRLGRRFATSAAGDDALLEAFSRSWTGPKPSSRSTKYRRLTTSNTA